MRCAYCGTANEEKAERCGHCGQELASSREQWQGPDKRPDGPGVPGALSPREEWDPARRYSTPRPMSGFVPPTNYPSHMGWAITVLLLCFPPTGIVAVLCASQVHKNLALGDDDRAWRYSQLAKLWCWISFALGVAIYAAVIYFIGNDIRHLSPYGDV
jgi:hypothetical protein